MVQANYMMLSLEGVCQHASSSNSKLGNCNRTLLGRKPDRALSDAVPTQGRVVPTQGRSCADSEKGCSALYESLFKQ